MFFYGIAIQQSPNCEIPTIGISLRIRICLMLQYHMTDIATSDTSWYGCPGFKDYVFKSMAAASSMSATLGIFILGSDFFFLPSVIILTYTWIDQ